MISSSVYSSIELRAAKLHHIPYFFKVFLYTFSQIAFAISFASFVFPTPVFTHV